MKKYNKKDVPREIIKTLHDKYGIDPLTASIFARRGITQGNTLLYFLEDDPRFLHEPFMFNSMEDAVDRIKDAAEEGEKVLIFGDRDVDGISSTAILYGYLKNAGLDVQWRLPLDDDTYGLSMAVINDFAKDFGSLIITVDCGISNAKEIEYANSLGIDVIVTDHHNPPESLPEAAVILDPKLPDSGYPFKDISGAAVAYKLVSALRFSCFELYNMEICLLDVRLKGSKYVIDCMKIRNFVKKAEFSQEIEPGAVSISDTKLPAFLKGQQIFVWKADLIRKQLAEIFGTGVEFNIMDLNPEISSIMPALSGKSLSDIKNLSKLAHYTGEQITEIEAFYNLFITFAEKKAARSFPKNTIENQKDLQLVALAALADIMPMKDENRIFVREGLSSINNGKTRTGLAELFARMDLAGKKLNSTDLSWKLIPVLNAAGRLGQPNLALQLLLSEDHAECGRLAEKILELNGQRKAFVSEAEMICAKPAEESMQKYEKKLCIVIDKRINRGITGILASHMMQKFDAPAIAVTFSEDEKTAVGSMRSCRGCIATSFLDSFGNIFINHGGHNCAAGFSMEAVKLNEFLAKAEHLASSISLSAEDNAVEIDAELPAEYITPKLLQITDTFEPFGEENKELVFLSKSLRIQDAVIVGKSERQHLKIIFDCGKYKFPAMYWGNAERLNRDFKVGDRLNVLYNISRNSFNGAVTPQMIIIDADISE